MKKLFSYFAMLAFLLTTTGCTQHLGNFTALSSSNFNAKNINNKHLVKKNVKGGSKSTLLFVPIGGYPKVDQAVAETLSDCGGDFLQNARVYSYYWVVLFFGEMGYKVEGDCYKTSN